MSAGQSLIAARAGAHSPPLNVRGPRRHVRRSRLVSGSFASASGALEFSRRGGGEWPSKASPPRVFPHKEILNLMTPPQAIRTPRGHPTEKELIEEYEHHH